MYTLPRNYAIENSTLRFKNIDLNKLPEKYGSPLRITIDGVLTENFNFLKERAAEAGIKLDSSNSYRYECGYAIKANQCYSLVKEASEVVDFFEVSSENDLILIETLDGKLSGKKIVCQGFKPLGSSYLQKIIELKGKGYNIMPVIDSMEEFYALKRAGLSFEFGVRLAAERKDFGKTVTERFGITYEDFQANANDLLGTKGLKLSMLHLHVSDTMQDSQLRLAKQKKLLDAYQICKENNNIIKYLNFGGGLPDRATTKDGFYDEYFERLYNVLDGQVDETQPIILMNELGRFLVAEAQLLVLKVISVKKNNEEFSWYIVDGSSINLIPEIFLDENKDMKILPINHTDQTTESVICGGITCDPEDSFNRTPINLPTVPKGKTLYVAITGTGAYQDSLLGSGRHSAGHCLINAPTDIHLANNGTVSVSHVTDPLLKNLGYSD